MKKIISLVLNKILVVLLSLVGISGCALRSISCAYGGPPEAYRQETDSNAEETDFDSRAETDESQSDFYEEEN